VKTIFRKSLAACCLAAMCAGGARADDVTDTIGDALAAYKNGEYTTAVEDLAYALELVKQKKGEHLKSYLPQPLEGWKADEAQAQTAGAAMMGGGTTVSRTYRRGSAEVRIEMVTDSPMMQSIAMMMSNPMFATADGGKMVRIHRQKAMLKYRGGQRSGEVTMLVANRYMITVSGSGVSEEELMAYARAIPVRKLASMR